MCLTRRTGLRGGTMKDKIVALGGLRQLYHLVSTSSSGVIVRPIPDTGYLFWAELEDCRQPTEVEIALAIAAIMGV